MSELVMLAIFVAVAALPVVLPLLPVTEPVIGLVTVRLPSVPTLVRLEAVTPEASVAPLNVPAAAVTVMSAVPLKLTPLMAVSYTHLTLPTKRIV